MRGSKDWSSLRIRARAASRADMEDLLACRDSVVAIVDGHLAIQSNRNSVSNDELNCRVSHTSAISSKNIH